MSQDDIVTLVLAEHGDVKERLEAFATDERTHTERGNFFAELADFLIRHEVAERMVLYPVLCMAPGGAAVVEARVAEQCEVADRIARWRRWTREATSLCARSTRSAAACSHMHVPRRRSPFPCFTSMKTRPFSSRWEGVTAR